MSSSSKSCEDHDFDPDIQFCGGASDHVAAWKEVQKVLADSDQDFDLHIVVFCTDGGNTHKYFLQQEKVPHLIIRHALVW